MNASTQNPFTVGAEAQLTRDKKLSWLTYRANHSNWTSITGNTLTSWNLATGWYNADKRLDATQSTYYTYTAGCDCGHLFTVTPHTEGFIPAKYIRTATPPPAWLSPRRCLTTTSSVSTGHYVEATARAASPTPWAASAWRRCRLWARTP